MFARDADVTVSLVQPSYMCDLSPQHNSYIDSFRDSKMLNIEIVYGDKEKLDD
jgi:hypothetical protein